MVDFRVPDSIPEKPTHRALGLAANGLWAMAGAYATGEENDGWVPRHFVESWPLGRPSARRLVDAEVWRPEVLDGVPGYRFTDWTTQRSATQIQAEREAARQRMASLRRGHNGQSGSDDVRPNTTRTFARSHAERSANVRDSQSQSRGGQLGGVSPVGRYAPTRGTEYPPPEIPPQSAGRPPERCATHADIDGDPGPCRPCGDARRAVEAWNAETARFDAAARSTEARRRAEDRARDIANCGLCDANGYIGRQFCDHDPSGPERAARGRAAVQAALGRQSDTGTSP
jgi:hypothetical protein